MKSINIEWVATDGYRAVRIVSRNLGFINLRGSNITEILGLCHSHDGV